MIMEWEKLLTKKRLGKNSPEDLESARTCFQRDYDRIVFSSPFRRLKDKTQVFSLPQSDYLRTRLIHSIEVSCVGRSLGTRVGYEIVNRHQLKFNPSDFGDIVSAACLAHDIGNPPFGHAGEDAIRSGFKSWYKTTETCLDEWELADFNLFEGNAQGFRIMTHLEMQPRKGGMQLTYPTLAAFTKYPRESYIKDSILNGYSGKSVAKYGFFQSEKELFAEVADEIGLIRRSQEVAWWARHPLAFLVEAADDICYRIVDVEDGCRMGYITFGRAKELLNVIAQCSEDDLELQANSDDEKIKYLRARAINQLVKDVAEIFLAHEIELLAGKFDKELVAISKYADVLEQCQLETHSKVINHPDVVSLRIAGYEVLGNLFADFAEGVLLRSEKGLMFKQMLPKQYQKTEQSYYQQILQITDYISGMTDSYATNLFRKFKGIALK